MPAQKESTTVIGKKIRDMRIKLSMTQAELAEKADITQATLSYIEVGTNSPRMDTIKTIAAALGVTLNDLMVED